MPFLSILCQESGLVFNFILHPKATFVANDRKFFKFILSVIVIPKPENQTNRLFGAYSLTLLLTYINKSPTLIIFP